MAGSELIPESFVAPAFWSKWARKFTNIKYYDNKAMQTETVIEERLEPSNAEHSTAGTSRQLIYIEKYILYLYY